MGEDGKKPPGKGKKNPLKIVKDSSSTRPSTDQVKQLYMRSPHIEWISFANHMKWDNVSSRNSYPVADWVQEKKHILAREQAEQIAELIFDHRSRWHRDVLKTLREYPEANDAMLGILKKRLNDMIQIINEDEQNKIEAAKKGEAYSPEFRKIKTGDLLALTAAIKTVTESKHKSLLINDWSVKVAEQFTDPNQFEIDETKLKDTNWTIEVIGGENLTANQMQKFLGDYYDRPMQHHAPQDVGPVEEPPDDLVEDE